MSCGLSHPGVSVIIPAYNVACCLRQAVESALEQTPGPREVIVINDGSTDETAAVARSFGQKIIYVEQPNQGQGGARNAGLRIAQGEFIGFLDADDHWLPGFLAACAGFLRDHPDAIAVSTGLRFDRWGKPPLVLPDIVAGSAAPGINPGVLDDFFTFWGEHDHVRTGSNLIRRSVIEEAGYQQAHLRVSQDLEYWGYLGTFGKWGFIPQVLWVGGSDRVVAEGGWLRKYRKRRQLCPTVEQWEERIVPRLKAEDWPGFRKVRGRVATTFAQNHVLAGNRTVAANIVRRYGQEMPLHWSSRLLRAGQGGGRAAWWGACFLLRCREYQKAVVMSLLACRSERRQAIQGRPGSAQA